MYMWLTLMCTHNGHILNFFFWENEVFCFTVKIGTVNSRIPPRNSLSMISAAPWMSTDPTKLSFWCFLALYPFLFLMTRSLFRPEMPSHSLHREMFATQTSDKVYSSWSWPWWHPFYYPHVTLRTSLSVFSPSLFNISLPLFSTISLILFLCLE